VVILLGIIAYGYFQTAQREANARATEVMVRITAEANAKTRSIEAERQAHLARSRQLAAQSTNF
jgi:hypothetical protein